ncbi:hypothetical protein QE152_g30051 [Popillia japonica]|uniref:Uncharacterized protein n=1 Tax=Popillia japonica TaxID=7064 RepID=A0AAW1JEW2_POPJA
MDFKSITPDSDRSVTKMNYKMNQLTFQLQKLIRTCECTAYVFQYIILLQVLSSLFILITCLYVAASVSINLHEHKRTQTLSMSLLNYAIDLTKL